MRPALWWGEDVVLEDHIGGRFLEPWTNEAGYEMVTQGKVCELEPPERVALDWADTDWSFETRVTFDITEEGEGSRVHLTHSGWDAAPDADRKNLIDAHETGWAHHLTNLAACAESIARGD